MSERVNLIETVSANIIQTWQTSTLEGDGHSSDLALDQDTNTCAQTEKQRDLRWRVDLGDTHVITGVFVNAGKSRISFLTFFLLFVSLCNSY